MNEISKPIPEGEWMVLEILWTHDDPIPSSAIIAEYKEQRKLKDATIRTYITRLLDKEIIGRAVIDDAARVPSYLYFSKVGERETRAKQSEHFVKTYFKGNSGDLLSTLSERTRLDDQGIAALISQLEQSEE